MGFEKSSTGSFAGAGSAGGCSVGGCSCAAAAKAPATGNPAMAVMMHPTIINIKVNFVFIFTPLSIYTLLHVTAIVHNKNTRDVVLRQPHYTLSLFRNHFFKVHTLIPDNSSHHASSVRGH
jgi:hypothetical protein